jgi:hypothetical protein
MKVNKKERSKTNIANLWNSALSTVHISEVLEGAEIAKGLRFHEAKHSNLEDKL